jgi:hypothetical protein
MSTDVLMEMPSRDNRRDITARNFTELRHAAYRSMPALPCMPDMSAPCLPAPVPSADQAESEPEHGLDSPPRRVAGGANDGRASAPGSCS